MTAKATVAVVGLGSMGRNHVRVLSSLANIELSAVCDRDLTRLVNGPWDKVTDYRDLQTDGLAYCVIATPTNTHLEICRHFLERGVPLLVEKPAVSSAAEADMLIGMRNQQMGIVAVGMIERFNRTAEEARNFVRSGRMGRLLKISTRRVGPPPGRDMGVGVLIDLGIHDLDLVSWISGEQLSSPQVRSVSNVVSNHDDLALVTGRLASGTIFSIDVSWLNPVKRREIELVFTLGSVTLDLLSGEVLILELSGETIEWDAIRDFFGTGRAKRMMYGVKTVEPLVAEHQAMHAALSSRDWSKLPSLEESHGLLTLIEGIKLENS